jgi:GT2 family glycosyltransferase
LFWRALLERAEVPGGVDLGVGFRFGDSDIEIVLLRAEQNNGYAAGCNLGIQFALADPATTDLWILNSDVLFERDALQQLLAASNGMTPAVYGATLLYHDDPGTIQAAGGAVYWPLLGRSRHRGKGQRVEAYPKVARHLDYIVGAAMFFPRHVIETVGLFPESFFLYFEETEWCARARECGYEMVWVPESRVVHKEGKSTGAGERFRKLSNISFRYVVRNSLIMSHARYPLWLPTVLLWNFGESIWYWIKGDRKKLKVFVNAVREYWALRSSLTA